MNIKITISVIFFLTILFGCASNSFKYAEENMPKHHTEDGYQNYPFVETAASKGILFYLRRAWSSVFTPDIPEGHKMSESDSIELLRSIKGNRITWLGHASFLITTSNLTILADPFLSEFASPISWAGPKRFVESPISINKLPAIDVIIISHSHYDHLDDKTVRNLKNKESIHVVVPLGLRPFFIERGYLKVTELDWTQSVSIKGIKFTAEPAVHDSARSMFDHNKTLWASWVIESIQTRIIFIGDSGYSTSVFSAIGDKYSEFDFAILPIGAYEPRKLMWMSHTIPEEAVSIGVHLKAKALVASHWGTVSSLSDEPMFEPPVRFRTSAIERGFLDKDLWVMKVGETRSMLSEEN